VGIGVRAAVAVTLLMGFYVLGVVLLVAVVGLDVLILDSNTMLFVLVGLPFTAAMFALVGLAFRATLVLPDRAMDGVAVLETEQPALWAMVRAAAAAAGVAPPEFVWIESWFNAAVYEQPRWFGLRSGPRHLIIGAPMLIAFSPAKLDAVLAHEFGHFAHQDTRLLPLIRRGRAGLAWTLNTAGFFKTTAVSSGHWLVSLQIVTVRLIRAYAVRFMAITQQISRAQEYAADRISAELCGRDTAAGVLAEIPAYHVAYQQFRQRFADAGVGLGLVPEPEVLFAGFGEMLHEPRWQAAVESERNSPSAQEQNRFDSHPPMPDRVAALRALPDDGRAEDTSQVRAIDVLNGAQSLLAEVARHEAHFDERRPVDWDALTDAAARAHVQTAAVPLLAAMQKITGTPPTLGEFLDHVEAGHMETLLRGLLTPTQIWHTQTAPSAALEIGANVLAPALRAWVTLELADAGLVRWRHSWSKIAIREPENAPAGIGTALEALIAAEPSQAAAAVSELREQLKDAGVPA